MSPDPSPAPFVRLDRGPRGRIRVETDRYVAEVANEGYVSGIAAGTFRDKTTGARDLGFGLSVVDFLLEPAPSDEPISKGQYEFGNRVHGDIAKRYVEGPQICTQARRLPATFAVAADDSFAGVRLHYRWHVAYPPHTQAGSVWEQTLVFPRGERYFFSADRVTTASESPGLFFRVDMPGHIKHREGKGFEHVYLSYNDPAVLPSTEFTDDFAPDDRFLYRRGSRPHPDRFIRAYQVNQGPKGEPGPWLAGMTLNPDDVYQAWCHERGYVCMIEELGGRPARPDDTFGACYLIGWFDDIDAMHRAYDAHRGASGLALDGPATAPNGFRLIKHDELTPISIGVTGIEHRDD